MNHETGRITHLLSCMARGTLLCLLGCAPLHSQEFQLGAGDCWAGVFELPNVEWDFRPMDGAFANPDILHGFATYEGREFYFGAADQIGWEIFGPEVMQDFYTDIMIDDYAFNAVMDVYTPNEAGWLGINWQAFKEPIVWKAYHVDDALADIDDVELPWYVSKEFVNDTIATLPPIPTGNPRHDGYMPGELRVMMPHEKLAVHMRYTELRQFANAHYDKAAELAETIPDNAAKAAIAGIVMGYGAAKTAPDARAAALVALGAGAWAGGAAAATEAYDVVKELYKSCDYETQADYLAMYLQSGVCLNEN